MVLQAAQHLELPQGVLLQVVPQPAVQLRVRQVVQQEQQLALLVRLLEQLELRLEQLAPLVRPPQVLRVQLQLLLLPLAL